MDLFLPNKYYILDILWQVTRTGYSISHNQPIERFAAVYEWKDLLEENGLTVKRILRYNAFFPHTKNDLIWYKNHYRKIISLLVSPFIPFNLSNHFLYVCEKNTSF